MTEATVLDFPTKAEPSGLGAQHMKRLSFPKPSVVAAVSEPLPLSYRTVFEFSNKAKHTVKIVGRWS